MGDGVKEIAVGREIEENGKGTEKWALYWYKPGKDLNQPWTGHIIDPLVGGGPHDVLFADLDGDGKRELISNAMYSSTPGLYAYKPGADLTQPWTKQTVQAGLFAEGTAAGVLGKDGKNGSCPRALLVLASGCRSVLGPAVDSARACCGVP